jgi:hypothetical protein
MQHQVNTDAEGSPVYINLELSNGNLLIKDHDMALIKSTIGNPSLPPVNNANQVFNTIEEAQQWFLTTALSTRIDLEVGEE